MRQAKIFTVYAFDNMYDQYVRIIEMESKGLFNLLLPSLPYFRVYIKQGRGERFIKLHLGLKLQEVKTGNNNAKEPFEIGNVLHWGYEQQASNDEGSVDFDDAVRLACENDGMEPPTPAQRKEAHRSFKQEFKRR